MDSAQGAIVTVSTLYLSFGVFILVIGALSIAGHYIKRLFEKRSRARQVESDLDMIEKHGFKAHFYFPATGIKEDQLYISLERLKHAGYIFTREDGSLLGKVATSRPSLDQVADARRTGFKIVTVNQETEGLET